MVNKNMVIVIIIGKKSCHINIDPFYKLIFTYYFLN